jgi:lipopolysaccharide transport system permease protein
MTDGTPIVPGATPLPPRATGSGARTQRTFSPVKHRLELSELWTSTAVARMAALRDVRVKYRQSVLGPVWLLLQPLGLLAALMIAFAGVMKADTSGVSSLLFTIVGVAVWTFVQQTLTAGATAMISNSPLVRRSTCPRVALVTGSIIANSPTLVVMTVLSLVLSVIINGPVVQMLLLPLMALWLVALMWGPCLLFAGISTRFRDAVAIVPMLMQAGVFLTPIAYSIKGAPHLLQAVLWLNPVTGMMEAWRWSMLGVAPSGAALASCAVWTLILPLIGWWTFSRLEIGFADYL